MAPSAARFANGVRAGSALFAVLLLVAGTAPARGADLGTQPPGGHITLKGKVSLSGNAPLPVGDLPPGSYRLEAQGLATALARGRLLRRDDQFMVEPSASALALLWPPGLKHLEQGETGRGMLLLAGGVGSAAMALTKDTNLRELDDDLRREQARYDDAVSQDEILAARLDLELVEAELDKNREVRNLWGAYFGLLWVGAAAEQWLLTPVASLEEGPSLDLPIAGGAAAGLRSLVAPGSGQRYLGHSSRGNFFTLGFLGLGAATLVAHEAVLDARLEQADAQRRYDAARTEAEVNRWRTALTDAADEADSRNVLRWVLAGATAGVYAWNVLDAWSGGHAAGEAGPLRVSLAPAPEGLAAAVVWRIP